MNDQLVDALLPFAIGGTLVIIMFVVWVMLL